MPPVLFSPIRSLRHRGHNNTFFLPFYYNTNVIYKSLKNHHFSNLSTLLTHILNLHFLLLLK